MSLEDSIAARLAAVSALTDLVGTNIYRYQRERASGLPAVVFTRETTDPSNYSEGDTVTRHAIVTVDSISYDMDEVRNVSQAVLGALSGWSDTGGDPNISPVIQVRDDDVSELPEHGTDQMTFRISQDYSFWYAD